MLVKLTAKDFNGAGAMMFSIVDAGSPNTLLEKYFSTTILAKKYAQIWHNNKNCPGKLKWDKSGRSQDCGWGMFYVEKIKVETKLNIKKKKLIPLGYLTLEELGELVRKNPTQEKLAKEMDKIPDEILKGYLAECGISKKDIEAVELIRANNA